MTVKDNLKLFNIFFRIGLGTIGGGFVMIPMMQQEIVDKAKLLEKEDFLNILAVSQATPGVFAANMASHIGYKMGGLLTALICVIGNILPSIVIILVIAMSFSKIEDNKIVRDAFMAIRPVVVALISVTVLRLAQASKTTLLFVVTALLTACVIYFKIITPIYIVVITVVFGISYGLWLSYRAKKNKRI